MLQLFNVQVVEPGGVRRADVVEVDRRAAEFGGGVEIVGEGLPFVGTFAVEAFVLPEMALGVVGDP